MGKLKIKGNAKREFKADVMKVNISVSVAEETPALAIAKGKKETERVLQLLLDLGFHLSDVSMEKDHVSKPSYYKDDNLYHFTKELSFVTAANLSVLDALSDGIVQNEINATYNETFYLSDVEAVKKAVLQEALLDARKKAEAIAETLNQKVIGIESAKCDEYKEEENEEQMSEVHGSLVKSITVSTMISPKTTTVEKSIDVTWVID